MKLFIFRFLFLFSSIFLFFPVVLTGGWKGGGTDETFSDKLWFRRSQPDFEILWK